jgi:hypothetical protein
MAKSPFLKGVTTSPWFSRRAGSNAGGSHPRYNNEGLLVDENNDTIVDGTNAPIELDRVTDQSQDEEILFEWDPTVDLGTDAAAINALFAWNGFVYIQGNNSHDPALGYFTLNFINDHPTAPRVCSRQAFTAGPSTRMEIGFVYQTPAGPPYYQPSTGGTLSEGAGRFESEYYPDHSTALTPKSVYGEGTVLPEFTAGWYSRVQYPANEEVLGKDMRAHYYPLGDNPYVQLSEGPVNIPSDTDRIRVYSFKIYNPAL